MSRLVADQESRGGDEDPGAGEKDSVMRMTLSEGFQAVNAETRRVEREARDRRERRDVNRLYSYLVSLVPQVPRVSLG
jgi:hypothetical protein